MIDIPPFFNKEFDQYDATHPFFSGKFYRDLQKDNLLLTAPGKMTDFYAHFLFPDSYHETAYMVAKGNVAAFKKRQRLTSKTT